MARFISNSTASGPMQQSWTAGRVTAGVAVGGVGVCCGATAFAEAPVANASTAASTPPADVTGGEIVLWQYEVCPFCNKVRAFLDFHNIPYRVVEVEPMRKAELKWSAYRKVPVASVGGVQVNDSSAIISYVAAANGISSDLGAEARAREDEWRAWVDDQFVRYIGTNIYRTVAESLESFDYITANSNFTRAEKATIRYAGAAIMYAVANFSLKKKYNIQDPRAEMYAAADTWVGALEGAPFNGGASPNLADVSMFGVLRAMMGMQAGRDILANTGIEPWYRRMEEAVGESCATVAGPGEVEVPTTRTPPSSEKA